MDLSPSNSNIEPDLVAARSCLHPTKHFKLGPTVSSHSGFAVILPPSAASYGTVHTSIQ